jgi:hypothetical protein
VHDGNIRSEGPTPASGDHAVFGPDPALRGLRHTRSGENTQVRRLIVGRTGHWSLAATAAGSRAP